MSAALVVLIGGGAAAMPTISLGDRSPKERLQEAILEVVRSEAGRPVPAQKVFSLLPSEFVTSVAQILAMPLGKVADLTSPATALTGLALLPLLGVPMLGPIPDPQWSGVRPRRLNPVAERT